MNMADAVLAVFMLLITWSFYLAQRNPNNEFNLFDLVMENGRFSRIGFAFMVALFVTSWVLIRVARDGKTDIGILYSAYLAAWVIPIVAKLFSSPPPSGTITTDSKITTTQVIDKPAGAQRPGEVG